MRKGVPVLFTVLYRITRDTRPLISPAITCPFFFPFDSARSFAVILDFPGSAAVSSGIASIQRNFDQFGHARVDRL